MQAFFILLLLTQVFAQTIDIEFSTDKSTYSIGEVVNISGSISDTVLGYDVTVIVRDPNNSIYFTDQITPIDNRFDTNFRIKEGSLTGKYTIEIAYVDSKISKSIDVTELSEKTFRFVINDSSFNINYRITSGSIDRIDVDPEFGSLLIFLKDVNSKGMLEIELPREVIDAKIDDKDEDFIVTVDGEIVDYQEISKDSDSRTIKIEYDANSSDIEIIGTRVIPEFPIAVIIMVVSISIALMYRRIININ